MYKKKMWCGESLEKEAGRELTESELAGISGGTGASQGVTGWPEWLTGQDKPAQGASGKNNNLTGLPALAGLSGLTSTLLGTLIPQPQ